MVHVTIFPVKFPKEIINFDFHLKCTTFVRIDRMYIYMLIPSGSKIIHILNSHI